MWVDNNIRFQPQSFVLKNDNYHMVHWHIRPQSDDEQGLNTLRPNQIVKSTMSLSKCYN